MPDTSHVLPHATYRRMEDGTKQEYELVHGYLKEFQRDLATRVLKEFVRLEDSYPGEPVDRLVHSLQTATRAHRDGQDEEYVVAALLHDLGDLLATSNHSEYAASILKPYVRPNVYWTVRQHGLFQGYYYFHHFGLDRNAREQYPRPSGVPDVRRFLRQVQRAGVRPRLRHHAALGLRTDGPSPIRPRTVGPHTKLDGGYREQF